MPMRETAIIAITMVIITMARHNSNRPSFSSLTIEGDVAKKGGL
jgi:hypothetical protein